MPVATLSATMSTMLPMPVTAALPAGIPSPSSAVWYLGPIPVRAYALCILAGVFVAVWWSDRRYRARGGRPDLVLDVAIVAVPAGIVGARLYHVVSSPDDYFGPNGDLSRIPQTWQGGLGIWGGIAGGVLAGMLLLRHRGLRVAPLATPSPRRCWSLRRSVDWETGSTRNSTALRRHCPGGCGSMTPTCLLVPPTRRDPVPPDLPL